MDRQPSKAEQRLPRAVWLYHAGRVELDDRAARAAAEAARGDLYARARAILGAADVVRLATGTVDDLALVDLHVLIACLLHAGVLHDVPTPTRCDNCGEVGAVDAAANFEWGPFVDHELDDEVLDQLDGRPHVLPLHARGARRRLRFRPRTLRDVAPLLAIDRDAFAARRVSFFLLETLGLEPVPPTRPRDVLSAVNRLGPRTMAAFTDAWHRAHLTPRLSATHRCSCGAGLTVRVPRSTLMDLFGREEAPRRLEPPPDFPELEAFERLVRDAKRAIYRDRSIGDLRLIVDDGVAAVDDAGVPLLGSYVPPSVDGDERGEIRLYYQTFRDEAAMDPRFDVEGEIWETLEHEVIHHENFLRGYDPVDEEERLVIAKERERVVGKKELVRREGAFWLRLLRDGWPLFAIIVAVAVVSRCFG